MKNLKKLKEAVQRGESKGTILRKGFQKIRDAIFSGFFLLPFTFPKRNALKTEERRWRFYHFLRWRYKKVIKNALAQPQKEHLHGERIIWWCWLQGLEEAPELIRLCLDSVKKQAKGYEIRVISESNLTDYVELPDYINEKYQKGLITRTHYSDLIRTDLLVHYGGVWIDSTVFLTGWKEDLVQKSSLFAFRTTNAVRAVKASSWFIAAVPGDRILSLVRDFLMTYWKTHDRLLDYYLFHLFFSIAADCFPEEWRNSPNWNNVNPHLLQREVKKGASAEDCREFLPLAWAHKLTYKLEETDMMKLIEVVKQLA